MTIFFKVKAFLLPIIIFYVFSGILGCAPLSRKVETLQMLRRLGHNDKLKQQVLKQETIFFQRLKNYIDTNKIKKGISGKSAIKKFGEPVSVLAGLTGEKWAYKPQDADWINGEKIYLFFNTQSRLIDWECVNCSKQ